MKLMKGRVVSDKMEHTAVVLVEGKKTSAMYGKSFVYSKKYLVDDGLGVKVGDVVEFEKCAPVSKRKHWRMVRVIGRDIVAVETEVMKEVAEEAIEEVIPEETEESTVSPEEVPAADNESQTTETSKKPASRKQKSSKEDK